MEGKPFLCFYIGFDRHVIVCFFIQPVLELITQSFHVQLSLLSYPRLKSTIHNGRNSYVLTSSVCCYDFSTLIVVITAAEGGENFWGPIKDRYWVLV